MEQLNDKAVKSLTRMTVNFNKGYVIAVALLELNRSIKRDPEYVERAYGTKLTEIIRNLNK